MFTNYVKAVIFQVHHVIMYINLFAGYCMCGCYRNAELYQQMLLFDIASVSLRL